MKLKYSPKHLSTTILLLLLNPLLFPNALFGQSGQKIQNLKTFAKLYGYVKYFHPSDEAAVTDWDKFAIYGADKVQNCETKEQLLKTLRELFLPIAPTIKIFNTGDDVKFNVSEITPADPKIYKPTYWQHKGLGLGMDKNYGVYKSIRMNRMIPVEKNGMVSSGSGSILTYIDAKEYSGKTIKYTGYVKLKKGSKGTGHLWLRVDKSNLRIGFSENMDKHPIRATSWKKCEIVGKVDSLAGGISLGCYLEGTGELLVDDLHLYYLENGKWIEIPIYNNGFESDKIGTSLKEKTWMGKGEDYEIGIDDKGCKEGKKCVFIGKEELREIFNNKQLFDAAPGIGEVINKSIGSGLSCIVPLALCCTEMNTYPVAKDSALKSLLEEVDTDDNSEALRLGDIIITWNIFQHFYPYFDVVKVDWEKEMETALVKSYTDQDANDFLITLEQFTAPLKDGHIRLSLMGTQNRVPGITWEFVENKLVITRVCDPEIKLKVGNIVTEINGMSPENYFANVEKRISAATPGSMAYKANRLSLYGERGSLMALKVNDTIIELACDEKPNSCKNSISESGTRFRWIDNGIIYLNMDLIQMKTIDSLLPQLIKAKAIICDLRGYPNGNEGFISYLLKKNDKDKWMYIPHFIYPDRENVPGYNEVGWYMDARKPHISAKIFFIIDGRAISYAESYMGFIEGYHLATIIGQPTAGTNGNVNSFTLPGHYDIYWTGMKVLKHDGSRQHGIGILPNIYVSKTVNGIIEGKDEFLEKAIELARKAE